MSRYRNSDMDRPEGDATLGDREGWYLHPARRKLLPVPAWVVERGDEKITSMPRVRPWITRPAQKQAAPIGWSKTFD